MEDNSKKEIEEILEEINIETADETPKQEVINQTEQENITENNVESWSLICYTEKTLFQKIAYSLKKLFNLTKDRILGKA